MYLNDWEGYNFIDLIREFSDAYDEDFNQIVITIDDLKKETWAGVDVLLASYTNEWYNGDAFVLFKKNGKLYEVNASHCSCHGLEGQWDPEETCIDSLKKRLEDGRLGVTYDGVNVYADELRQVIEKLSQ